MAGKICSHNTLSQLPAEDGLPPPAARQRHLAAGTTGCKQRHSEFPLPLCCLQLLAGRCWHSPPWGHSVTSVLGQLQREEDGGSVLREKGMGESLLSEKEMVGGSVLSKKGMGGSLLSKKEIGGKPPQYLHLQRREPVFSTCPSPTSRPQVCPGIALAWAGQSLPPQHTHTPCTAGSNPVGVLRTYG